MNIDSSKTQEVILKQPQQSSSISHLRSLLHSKHSNKIVSSKYSLLSFFPLNIIHQLSKPSTFFFFITLILMCIPSISPFEPWTYMLAFGIVVGISMTKDAVEDYKRHVSDKEINERICFLIEKKDQASDSNVTLDDSYSFKEKKVMDITLGDWLILKRNEEVPADVILMQSIIRKEDRIKCANYCFIETSNLDGESNLKKRASVSIEDSECNTSNIITRSSNEGSFISRKPSEEICPCFKNIITELDKFKISDTGESLSEYRCELFFKHRTFLATEKNILLRGSVLKNTEKAICLVVGVGNNTKQSKSVANARKAKSIFEKKMDYMLKVVLAVYFVMLIITTCIGIFYVNVEPYYSGTNSNFEEIIKLMVSNDILYSYLIPLSLYVMVELSRFFHTYYIKYDRKLKIDGIKSICRNSNVIEDLGTIDYILSDKTGTITKNSMTLRAFHLNGSKILINIDQFFNQIKNENEINKTAKKIHKQKLNYQISSDYYSKASEESTNSSLSDNYDDKIAFNNDLLFIMNILVNNSVEVLNNNYEGISQDELCFLKEFENHGFKLIKREENYVKLEINGIGIYAEILLTLDFTSKRQRMGNLVKIGNRYFLFMKGSDQKLLDKNTEKELIDLINRSSDFRSLVMKYKEMSLSDLKMVREKMEPCLKEMLTNSNTNKIHWLKIKDYSITKFFSDPMIKLIATDKIFDDISDDMKYLGSTFIEDELQNGVQDTIKSLKKAGIKIWMITGDKKETAISCGKNSGIITANNFIDADGKRAIEEIERLIALEKENPNRRLSNSSSSLMQHRNYNINNTITNSEPMYSEFGSRISSMQELSRINQMQSELEESGSSSITMVEMPQEEITLFDYESVIIYRATPSQKGKITNLMTESDKFTLAIGDGNNDVAMLKNANVGVGIMGKEGTQASLTADFAIPQFKALKRLLLIHGRYNLMRYSKIALNSYYKNIFFIFIQFFYNIYNGASGRSIYNDFFMNYYNLFFTSLIPFSTSLFDRDYPEEYLYENPRTYMKAREYFNKKYIYYYIGFGIIEAVVVFYLLKFFLMWDLTNNTGKVLGFGAASTFYSLSVFYAVIIRQYKSINYYVIYNYLALGVSIFLILLMLFGLQELSNTLNHVIYNIFSMPVAYIIAFAMMGSIYMIDGLFELVNLIEQRKIDAENKS